MRLLGMGRGKAVRLIFFELLCSEFFILFRVPLPRGGKRGKRAITSAKEGFWVDRRSEDFDEDREAEHGNGNRCRS